MLYFMLLSVHSYSKFPIQMYSLYISVMQNQSNLFAPHAYILSLNAALQFAHLYVDLSAHHQLNALVQARRRGVVETIRMKFHYLQHFLDLIDFHARQLQEVSILEDLLFASSIMICFICFASSEST